MLTIKFHPKIKYEKKRPQNALQFINAPENKKFPFYFALIAFLWDDFAKYGMCQSHFRKKQRIEKNVVWYVRPCSQAQQAQNFMLILYPVTQKT